MKTTSLTRISNIFNFSPLRQFHHYISSPPREQLLILRYINPFAPLQGSPDDWLFLPPCTNIKECLVKAAQQCTSILENHQLYNDKLRQDNPPKVERPSWIMVGALGDLLGEYRVVRRHRRQ